MPDLHFYFLKQNRMPRQYKQGSRICAKFFLKAGEWAAYSTGLTQGLIQETNSMRRNVVSITHSSHAALTSLVRRCGTQKTTIASCIAIKTLAAWFFFKTNVGRGSCLSCWLFSRNRKYGKRDCRWKVRKEPCEALLVRIIFPSEGILTLFAPVAFSLSEVSLERGDHWTKTGRPLSVGMDSVNSHIEVWGASETFSWPWHVCVVWSRVPGLVLDSSAVVVDEGLSVFEEDALSSCLFDREESEVGKILVVGASRWLGSETTNPLLPDLDFFTYMGTVVVDSFRL